MAKPKLNEAGVHAALARWQKRQDFRWDKVRYYRHTSKRADRPRLEAKWRKSGLHANERVRHFQAGVKWYADHKPVDARAKAVLHAQRYAKAGTKEHPPGSNSGPSVTRWQKACAGGGSWLYRQPWCGVFCWNMLDHAGVKDLTSRMASVALIEDDARTGRYCYSAWTTNPGAVHKGDLVVLFGRGVHVELVLYVSGGLVHTVGGNTSAGTTGSQSNGGGVYRRARPMSAVRGFALVDFPG